MPSIHSSKKFFTKLVKLQKCLMLKYLTVRFWEKEFDILKPKKNKKGNRLFTSKDIENIKIIYHLLKERGFTLDWSEKKIKRK